MKQANTRMNEATEAYSHSSFFKKIKRSNEDYDTLTLNPVSVSSFKPELSCTAFSQNEFIPLTRYLKR